MRIWKAIVTHMQGTLFESVGADIKEAFSVSVRQVVLVT